MIVVTGRAGSRKSDGQYLVSKSNLNAEFNLRDFPDRCPPLMRTPISRFSSEDAVFGANAETIGTQAMVVEDELA